MSSGQNGRREFPEKEESGVELSLSTPAYEITRYGKTGVLRIALVFFLISNNKKGQTLRARVGWAALSIKDTKMFLFCVCLRIHHFLKKDCA